MKNFNEKCYKLLMKVPRGKVVTYKQIAIKLGSKGYRAVGKAMNKNKNLIEVPCYRVICNNGGVGGYARGVKEKVRLLQSEGIEVVDEKVDLERFGWKF